MSNIVSIFLNGVPGDDGICAFARPVLFLDAAGWMTQQIPTSVIPLCPLGETPFASEEQALRAVKLPENADILLVAAPVPELTAKDCQHLFECHSAIGGDVTMCCTTDAAGTTHRYPIAVFRRQTLCSLLQGAVSVQQMLDKAEQQGLLTHSCQVPDMVTVTNGLSAYEAQKRLMLRINMAHIANGVQILAPENTFIAPDAQIDAGASVLPGCIIRAGCKIGKNAVIGPNTILEQAEIGEGTSVNNSQVYESTVGAQATVGPFAYIRPGCQIGDHTRIGDFVELKKAQIGNGTKVSHLTYIGDADVGERVNFGCGTVVVNYDGYVKSKTVIGDDCFIGCNTNLVAPVTLGDRVFTAAGATITKNVPDGALAVARARQTNLDGWNDRRRAAHEKTES